MRLKCLLDKHEWNGCRCTGCGRVRDEGHDWGKNCEKCCQCGLARQGAHEWDGCTCLKCGSVRDSGHTYESGRCTQCGAYDWSALEAAIASGNAEAVTQYISSGGDPTITSLVLIAAGQGHVATVAQLLQAGASPNACYSDGETPLYRAACSGHVQVVELLLKCGAFKQHVPVRNDLFHSMPPADTPLKVACYRGDLAIVKALLAAGAAPDGDPDHLMGGTALMVAARAGHLAVCKALLEAGADPRRGDRQDHDASTYIRSAEDREALHKLLDYRYY
jgi:ankyrin repeat protein